MTGPGARRSIVYPARCSGNITKVSTSAMVSRTRTGTLRSPSPGSSMIMVPSRANIRMNAAPKAGRKETSSCICAAIYVLRII